MIKLTPAFLKQLWLTLGASLAFLILGLVRGYTASAIPSMEKINPEILDEHDNHLKSWIGAIPSLGAFVGSLFSGPLMQRLGRKRTLMVAGPLYAAGWLLLAFASNIPLVLSGRALTGLCSGFALAPVQVYVSECCDPEIRGQLGSLPTLSMSSGIVISYVAGNWLDWRYLAILSAVFSALMFVMLLPLPESPEWLERRGLDSCAAIRWLHLSDRTCTSPEHKGRFDIRLKEFISHGIKKAENEAPPSLFTRKVLFTPEVMKPMIIVFALLFFQQFSGVDAVIFFTVEIFQSAGSKLDPMMATIIVGLVQLVSNGVCTTLVDRAGRRPLLLISAAVMCAAMATMGASFFFEFDHDSFLGYLPILSLVAFMVGFSLGFGGLPFLLLGELFPAHYRSQLSGMASAINLLSMFTVIKTYHMLEAVMSAAGTFWLYSCFCAAAFFFVLCVVPETKGKSLEEIEEYFKKESNRSTEKA